MRSKEDEIDYRFFQEPDLPSISVTKERISKVRKTLEEIPFDAKRRFSHQFGLDVADVKVIFRHKWCIETFTRIIWQLTVDPKLAFKWVFEHILGNCMKKDLDF